MNVYESILYTIGGTPIVRLGGFSGVAKTAAQIYAKLEYCNPTGSVTDRAALYMINDAMKNGELKQNSLVIEAVSGNMGVSVAYICRMMKLQCVIVAPDGISRYNADLITSLGAKLVLTEKRRGVLGAVEYAEALWKKTTGSYMLRQFSNESAINAYHNSLGPELQAALGDEIDVLVCAVGSGSTLSGCAQFLRKWNPYIQVVAVEPKESAVLSGEYAAPHGIRGIGVGFMPENYNPYIVDRIITVPTGDSIRTAQLVWSTDGIPCGYSAGAALYAAAQVALEQPDKQLRIAVIIPDAAWRYQNSELFRDTLK